MQYTITRFCCTHGHCSLCVGGFVLQNRERIIQTRRIKSIGLAKKIQREWRDYGSEITIQKESTDAKSTNQAEGV